MLSDTTGQTLRRMAQSKLVSRYALLCTCLLALGTFIVWQAAARQALASPAFTAAAPLFECGNGCEPGYHCSRVEPDAGTVRSCEPDTTIPALAMSNGRPPESIEVVIPPKLQWQRPTFVKRPIDKTMNIDGNGCLTTSFGAYSLGKDGKCHWCPWHSFLGEDNKCHCQTPGFHQVKVDNKGKKNTAGQYFICEQQ